MPSLDQFLTGLETNHADTLEGKTSFGGFDGPPLATDRQYHAVISRAEWRQAQTSGKWQFAFTFEILGDPKDEFVGRKFTEYYSKDNGNKINDDKFSRLIAESGIDLKNVDRSSEATFAASFEGTEYIVATRIWGTDLDRTGLRYLNRYRNQEPLGYIAPPKSTAPKNPLRPEINVNKERGPEQPETEIEVEPTEVSTPSVALPGDGRQPTVNLPPGLR